METKREHSASPVFSVLVILQDIIAFVVIVMSLIVIAGWYLQEPALVQIRPTFAPMQYNTAVCFLLSGLGLFFLRRAPKLAGLFAIFLFIISFITMLQYIYQVNVGIDQLAMNAFTTVKTSHPGRMAPNTGTCFILTSIVLFLYGFSKNSKTVVIAGYIILLIIGVLSFAALFGYMSGLSTAYGWGNLTRMALHTSIGFIIITIALLLRFVTLKAAEVYDNTLLYPVSVFIAGLFLSILIWIAMHSAQQITIKKNTDQEGRFISQLVQRVLTQNVVVIDRLFYRAARGEYTSTASLNADIHYYFNHIPALSALSLQTDQALNPMMRVNKSISKNEGRSLLLQCKHAFIENKDSHIDGINNFLCVRDQLNNSIAVISLERLMKPLLAAENLNEFNIWIYQGRSLIYQTNEKPAFGERDNETVFFKKLSLQNIQWTLRIEPTEKFLSDAAAYFPNLLFAFSLIITIILCYMIRLWQQSLSQKNTLITSLNRQYALEKNMNTIIEASKEAILIVDENQKIRFCNNEATQLWGCKEADFLGKAINQFFPRQFLDEKAIFSREITYRDRINQSEATIHTQQGAEILVEVTINQIEYDSTPCLIFSLYDVSARARFQQQIKQQAQTIQLIYDITSSISDVKEINKSLQICLDMLCQSLKWSVGIVYKPDEKNRECMSPTMWYMRNPEKFSAFRTETENKKVYKGQGLIGDVWVLKKPRWVEDVKLEAAQWDEKIGGSVNVHSAIVIPIVASQEVLAVFEILSVDRKPLDVSLLHDIEIMSQQVGRLIERKQAIQKLEIAELKNRSLLNSAGEGIYGLDLQGRTTFVNNAAKYILGYAEKELLHQKMHDIIHHSYEDGTPYPVEDCPIYAAFMEGEEQRVDKDVFWKKNGTPVNVEYVSTPMFDDEAKIIGSVVVFNDITQRLALEKESREQEEFHRAAFESIQDYAIVALDTEGHIQSWNLGAEKIKGYTKEEALNQHFSLFYPADVADSLPKELLSVAAKEGRVSHHGWRIRKDGSLFWADVVINALYDEDGRVRGYIKITRDLTEQKKAEDELKSYSDELEKSNKELDSFAYIASHDLKEPLRGISNMSSFLLEDYTDKLDDTGKDYLTRLGRQCSRLENFIDALLEYSRVGRMSLAFKETNLNEVVSEKLELLDQFIKDHQANVQVESTLPTLICDQVRIGEVFMNLITNAIKYNDSDNKLVTISFKDEKDEVVFCVEDNGIGIDEKNYEKIFRIFSRLHGKDKYEGGTGAGMTIVKKIVERHGGKVWVDAKLGVGSKFYFTISKKLAEISEKEQTNES